MEKIFKTRISCAVLAIAILIAFCLGSAPVASAQIGAFHRTLEVGIKDPVTLDVVVAKGDVSFTYSRDGEVSIYASGKDSSGKNVTEEYFKSNLTIEQNGSHITLRSKESVPYNISNVSYRIDVPFRTQIDSSVLMTGNQRVIGVTGPVKLNSGEGNLDATYVRFAEVQATTGKGKISCTRVAQVNAETGSGSITLMENGVSKAVVKKGFGRIEIGGARGGINAVADGGEIHIKAVQDGDWKLTSNGGNIRIELPPRANFELNADTVSGTILIERDGVEKLPESARQVHRKVNAGGRQIKIHSGSGNIYIQ